MVVGGLSLGHLDGGDAQGPDVNLVVVVHATNEFGSHPEGSTYHALPLSFLLFKITQGGHTSWVSPTAKPKSVSLTSPFEFRRTLSLLISRWSRWWEWR